MNRLRYWILAGLGLAFFGTGAVVFPAGAQPGRPRDLQFDMFAGYGGLTPEAAWAPVVFDVKNDGPAFTGLVELETESYGGGPVRSLQVELPTGSLKRLLIPAFCGTRYGVNWTARLLDERGRVRAETSTAQSQNRGSVGWRAALVGALARTPRGAPVFPSMPARQPEIQPECAAFQPALFPDNPIVLERLEAVYLNSEKAAELKENQVRALLEWLHAGGHLIIGVEQIGDFNTSPWLRQILPCEFTGTRTLDAHPGLQEWVRGFFREPANPESPGTIAAPIRYAHRPMPPARPNGVRPTPVPTPAPTMPTPVTTNLAADSVFEAAPLPVVSCQLTGGRVVAGTDEAPLVIGADVDRGRVTVLLFSPEREPVRSWKNLPWFWAKLIGMPAEIFLTPGNYNRYEPSSDGIFGGMVDSRQVRKMPVGALLLLLVVYLAVIGPVDRWWLKRIGRPMLTWITFPAYVALFSLLIYFIGYRLRAGETEWNELHLVDVFAKGTQAELRGRTYASVYSPVSHRYRVASPARVATLRGEFMGNYVATAKSEAQVWQQGDTFSAEIAVPVWISRLYVSDWWQTAPLPVSVKVVRHGDGLEVTLGNHLDRPLNHLRLAVDGKLVDLETVGAGETKQFSQRLSEAKPLAEFVGQQSAQFQNVVNQRRSAFGHYASGWVNDVPNAAEAASFLSLIHGQGANQNFITPPGVDLTTLIERGQAVLLAWTADYAPLKPLCQFSPRRTHRDTLWRVSCPVEPARP